MKNKFSVGEIVNNIYVDNGSLFVINEINKNKDGIFYIIDNGSLIMKANENWLEKHK